MMRPSLARSVMPVEEQCYCRSGSVASTGSRHQPYTNAPEGFSMALSAIRPMVDPIYSVPPGPPVFCEGCDVQHDEDKPRNGTRSNWSTSPARQRLPPTRFDRSSAQTPLQRAPPTNARPSLTHPRPTPRAPRRPCLPHIPSPSALKSANTFVSTSEVQGSRSFGKPRIALHPTSPLLVARSVAGARERGLRVGVWLREAKRRAFGSDPLYSALGTSRRARATEKRETWKHMRGKV